MQLHLTRNDPLNARIHTEEVKSHQSTLRAGGCHHDLPRSVKAFDVVNHGLFFAKL